MGAQHPRALPQTRVSDGGLPGFQHRTHYGAAAGRDRWIVDAVNAWVSEVVPRVLAADAQTGAVLDVGCGEQPFRALVARSGRRYVGMDVVQNSTASVDLLSTLEDAPAGGERFPAVLCTEVLEHVVDVDAAFAGLRRLCTDGAVVVLTTPFVFPLHMEPYDFRRLTLHGIARLAAQHGFRVEAAVRLGGAPDVLATLLADASILPTTRSLYARAKTRALRLAKAGAIQLLASRAVRGNVVINSNGYLGNGVVLRASCQHEH
jgi:hypothetical protein